MKGVHLETSTQKYKIKNKRKDYVKIQWIATWYVKGKKMRRKFSVKKWGYDRALALALCTYRIKSIGNAPFQKKALRDKLAQAFRMHERTLDSIKEQRALLKELEKDIAQYQLCLQMK